MKQEEVGMKRRGPFKVLVGVAAAGIVCWLASSAFAIHLGPENIYTNDTGLNGAAGTVDPNRAAGPDVNPGGIGQVLFAGYYDVRKVVNPGPGLLEPQVTNLQIVNTAPVVDNTDQGVLARIRFRESKTSQEVLDFNIVLSCGQVWVASVFLDDAVDLPAITSPDPVVTNDPTAGGDIQFSPILTTPQRFIKPASLSNDDIKRGYFEVFAEEAIPCAPATGDERTGTYTRLGASSISPERTPPNTLGGVVFLVRAQSGISYEYNMTAISRFVSSGQGSITASVLSPNPNSLNCIFADGSAGGNCVHAVDLALAKNRIMFQWDELTITGAQTYLVASFPTKHHHCAVAAGDYTGASNDVSQAPFTCSPVASGGEEVGCTLYNRLEDVLSESNIFSPGEQTRCFLPREVTLLAMVRSDAECDPASPLHDLRCDVGLDYANLPNHPEYGGNANETGWVDIDTDFGLHFRTGLDPNFAQVLGLGVNEYRGMPMLAYVIQEFVNVAVQGVYGNMVPAMYEVAYGNAS